MLYIDEYSTFPYSYGVNIVSREGRSVAMAPAVEAGTAPLVVVGSVNADIYMEIDRLPKEGETISAKSGQTLPGGKGANQAACAARLGYPTYFIGQVGTDGHAGLVKDALSSSGVMLDCLNTVSGPTGHAIVMLQPQGKNSIIIMGGANTAWEQGEGGKWFSNAAQTLLQRAGAVLLQREIPDEVNIQAAMIARNADVPVIMDVGGVDAAIPEELLRLITVLSPNETELARLTGMPTSSIEQVIYAAERCLEMGVSQVLVKLGEQGALFLHKGETAILQPAILAPSVVDTTGAGDTFTAAYAVAILQGQECSSALKFAAAAASLCIRTKGAIPSMPDRESVLQLLQEFPPAS